MTVIEERAATTRPTTISTAALPRKRSGMTYLFRVGDVEGHLRTGTHPDGRLGEVFIDASKPGSTVFGLLAGVSAAASAALESGTAPERLLADWIGSSFPPQGPTDDAEIPTARSILDYAGRRLALDYLDCAACERMGVRLPRLSRAAG